MSAFGLSNQYADVVTPEARFAGSGPPSLETKLSIAPLAALGDPAARWDSASSRSASICVQSDALLIHCSDASQVV